MYIFTTYWTKQLKELLRVAPRTYCYFLVKHKDLITFLVKHKKTLGESGADLRGPPPTPPRTKQQRQD